MNKIFVINARGQYTDKVYALNIEASDLQTVEDIASDLGLIISEDGIGEVPQPDDFGELMKLTS